MPFFDPDLLRYGGNTTCFSVHTEQGVILIDAGTGLGHVDRELAALPQVPPLVLLLTHFHIDHIIGLPGFGPLYSSDSNITIMGDPRRRDNWKESLNRFMDKPYWPVGLGDSEAAMTLKDIPVEKDTMDLFGVRVSWFRVPHPQQCLSYRLGFPDGKSVVIATDVEYPDLPSAAHFVEFCKDADFLIYDAQFTPEEYPAHRGWGHSTWETGASITKAANAGCLVLTHHAPNRSDGDVDRIVREARSRVPRTIAARENLLLSDAAIA